MKRIIVLSLIAAATVSFTSCRKHSLRGEGSTTSETRDLAAFTSVDANGSTDIEIFASSQNKVIVTGYSNLIPVYETKVKNGRLTLEFDDKYINVKNNNIRVKLYTTAMSDIDLNGSGNVNIYEGMKASTMRVSINGSGIIDVAQNSFDAIYYKVNGSGDINGRSSEAGYVDADISGSGNIDVTVHNKLDAKISGSGSIDYWGSPAEVNTDISGSGKVRKNP